MCWGTDLANGCDNPAAALKKRVTIQNRSLSADGQGGFTELWANASTVWCSIEPVKGWERFQAMQAATPVTHKIVMRFNRTLSTASRLMYGDRYFEVREVLNRNEGNRFLDVRAVELESVQADVYAALLVQGGGYLLQQGGGRILLGL